MSEKKVIFKVQRYPGQGEPFFQEFEVPVAKGLTVLDGLIYIKENLDGSLSYRKSCRMGICGSCGMFINGLPRLACSTQVDELQSDLIQVQPLPNLPHIKDLVVDLSSLFSKHRDIAPYIIRDDIEEIEKPTRAYEQTRSELGEYMQFSFCIKCGICLAACPTMATDEDFSGPQALAQAYRYSVDTRDDGFDERIERVDFVSGIWRCHFAAACSHACPKGVDPAFGIQLLKKRILSEKFGILKSKKLAGVLPPPVDIKPEGEVAEAPEFTVKKP